MWELVCEGHWGSRSVSRQASNRQANKTKPARSSAADGKKLWIMISIIHKSGCHFPVSESQGMNPLTHTHPLLPLTNESPADLFWLSIMEPEWHIFSNTAMPKFIKTLSHCLGNGADTETNTSRNGYRHPKWAFLWRVLGVCVWMCLSVKNNVE